MAKAKQKIILLDLRPLQTAYKNRGIGRFTREVVKRLIAHPYEYRSLIFKTLPNPIPSLEPLIQAPLWTRPWIWDQFILPVLLWKNKITLFQNFVALGPLHEISCPIFFPFRTIAVIYDLHMFHEPTSPINRFYRKTMRIKIQKWRISKIRHCLVISQTTANDVCKQLDYPPKNITEVPLGCEHMDSFATQLPSGDSLTECLKTPSQTSYILTIGDTDNKNGHFSFQIIKHLKQQLPELNWIICGKKARIMSQLNLEENECPWITFVEDITDKTIAALYTHAELLLFPSLEEGFGLPVIEAMRMKCPVITGNNEPMKTSLGFDTGLNPFDKSIESLQAWSDACYKMIMDKEYRKQQIIHGRHRSDYFSWKRTTETFSDLYKKLET
ncbi:MAG: glycosyltransferase family 4 protein [Fibrobacteria bacterium]|nr:glycosyltransferase family 4 protein [Fibrobacteria bacterium]